MTKKVPIFKTLFGLCFAGILTAMSIILGKFLQIPNPFQEFIRISFENLPVIMAGFAFGPIGGGLVGAGADLIGCLLYGYTVNPIITLGGIAVGLVSGVASKYISKNHLLPRVIISVALAHAMGSVLIKSYGLAVWYLDKYELGYWEFVAWRGLNYLLVGLAECVIIYLVLKNSTVKKQFEKIRGAK